MAAARVVLVIALAAGGIGAGTAIAAFALAMIRGISAGDLFLPYSAAAIFLTVGFGCLWKTFGASKRSARYAWMRVALAAAALFDVSVAASWAGFANPRLDAAIAGFAALYLYAQAMAVPSGSGAAAWRAAEIPSLLGIAGIAEGVGAVAILGLLFPTVVRAGIPLSAAGMVLALMAAYRWYDFLTNAADNGLDTETCEALARLTPWYLVPGCALPLALYGAALATTTIPLQAAAGVAVIAGGLVWRSRLYLVGTQVRRTG